MKKSRAVFNGVGPGDTSRFYDQYKEDIRLMKEIGHNSFRLSISWSRLIPDGTDEVNQKAVAFYQDVIDEMLAHRIEPFVNLFHFDMPLALQRKGGWVSRDTVDAFEHYAKTCFSLFGDKVKNGSLTTSRLCRLKAATYTTFTIRITLIFKKRCRPASIPCCRMQGLSKPTEN